MDTPGPLGATPSRCDVCHSTRLQEPYSSRVDNGSVQRIVGCAPDPVRSGPVVGLVEVDARTLRPASAEEIDEGRTVGMTTTAGGRYGD